MRKRAGHFIASCGLLLSAAASASPATAAPFEVRDSVLTVSSAVNKIPDGKFTDRTDFHTVVFAAPAKVTEIGAHAFMGCTNLRSITLPTSLRKLGEGAFRECSALEEVSIPKGVSVIPKQAFAWCTALRQVNLPQRVTDIASHAFAYCRSLEAINFPSRLDHIGSNAFSFCSSLREAALPSSIRELESYAFAECDSLRKVTLPANPNMLGELIFSGSRNMEEIIEMSPKPPTFDCNSTLFDAEEEYMYRRCRLTVPQKSENEYQTAQGWKLFYEF